MKRLRFLTREDETYRSDSGILTLIWRNAGTFCPIPYKGSVTQADLISF